VTRKLNDFKKKITSYPFESDAIKNITVIDNEYYKYLFFLGNITMDDDGDFDYTYGCLYCYNAVSDQLNKLDGNKFKYCSFDAVSKKNLGWRFDEANSHLENDGCSYGTFYINDYSDKGFCIIQFNGVGSDGIIKVSMTDLSAQYYNGEIVQGKYMVEYDRWGPQVGPIDTRMIKKVLDVTSGQEIDNPFTKAGAVSFVGSNNTQIDLIIHKNASVTGTIICNGRSYTVQSGNETMDGTINLSVDYNNGIDCFIITKKGGRYNLRGVETDVWDVSEKLSVEVFKQ
jgi:hypothetical protein